MVRTKISNVDWFVVHFCHAAENAASLSEAPKTRMGEDPHVPPCGRVLHRIRQSRIQKFALMAQRHHRAVLLRKTSRLANTLPRFLLRRTRLLQSAYFAFAASKWTAKTAGFSEGRKAVSCRAGARRLAFSGLPETAVLSRRGKLGVSLWPKLCSRRLNAKQMYALNIWGIEAARGE